jgi:hypothetical protein
MTPQNNNTRGSTEHSTTGASHNAKKRIGILIGFFNISFHRGQYRNHEAVMRFLPKKAHHTYSYDGNRIFTLYANIKLEAVLRKEQEVW